MIVNIWLAVRTDAYDLIRIALGWDEEANGPYVGPLPARAIHIFEKMIDIGTVEGLFKVVNFGGVTILGRQFFGRDWRCFNVTFPVEGRQIQKAKEEIDWLLSADPNRIFALGAWDFETGNVVGGYTPHPRILDFIPDGTLESANVMFGQAPRKLI